MKTSIKARKKTKHKIKGYLNMVLLGRKSYLIYVTLWFCSTYR